MEDNIWEYYSSERLEVPFYQKLIVSINVFLLTYLFVSFAKPLINEEKYPF